MNLPQIIFLILGILLALVLLVVLLAAVGKIRVRLTYKKKLAFSATLFGIFRIYSNDEKEEELEDCRDPDKVLKKELRRLEKEKEKKRKKLKAKQEKAAKRAKNKARKKAGLPVPNLLENAEMYLNLVKTFSSLARGKVILRPHRVILAVGSDDAAKTAILYGLAVQGVTHLWYLVEPTVKDEDTVRVYADYAAEKTTLEADISVTVTPWQALMLYFKMNKAYKKEQKKTYQKAKRRVLAKKAASTPAQA